VKPFLARRAGSFTLAATVLGCAASSSPMTPPTGGAAGTDAGVSTGGAGAGGGGPAGGGAAGSGGNDAGATPDGPPLADAAPEASRDAFAAPGCGALALCDDFEGAAAGGPPDPARWEVGAPNVTGTGALAVDDAQHHSGSRSVKVTGQGGYSNHIFFSNASAIGALGSVVWARFYVRLSDALGDGHTTFLAMKDTHDGGKYLRMGGQSKILMWNRESDDATLPALSPTGIAQSRALPAGQWLCVEFMVDGRQGQLRTWVDGAEIAGARVDATATPDVDEPWLRKADWGPTLTDFGLGWESYAGQAMTLWFDDVALGAARVGCQ
jgi:hypothetical protein